MLSKDSSKDGILEKAAANVVPVDDPHEKRQAQDQMKFMNRIPKAALASILSSWLYFGYSFKCLLDAQAGGLSGTPLKVAWLAYAMQLGHASKSSHGESCTAAELGLTALQFPRGHHTC